MEVLGGAAGDVGEAAALPPAVGEGDTQVRGCHHPTPPPGLAQRPPVTPEQMQKPPWMCCAQAGLAVHSLYWGL